MVTLWDVPVSGAQVQLGTLSTTTAGDGTFSFANLVPGVYSYMAQEPEGIVSYGTVSASAPVTELQIRIPDERDSFRVYAVYPKLNDSDVRLNSQIWITALGIRFGVTPEDFTITPDIGPFDVFIDGDIIKLRPLKQLPIDTDISVSVEGAIFDSDSRALAVPVRFKFRTKAIDDAAPVLIDTFPRDHGNSHPINVPVRFSFNEDLGPLDQITLDVSAYSTEHSETTTPVTVQIDGASLLLIPEGGWLPNTGYEIFIDGVQDAVGNVYRYDGTFDFSTTNVEKAASNKQPEWSPALNAIVFTSDMHGDRDIYSIRPDGTELSRLSSRAGDEFHPSVSDDGQLLAWQAQEGTYNDWQIFVAPLSDPGSAVAVTPSDANDSEPRFARTGSRSIVFVSDRLGTPQLFRMAADGSGYGALSPGFGSAQFSPAPHPLIDNQLLFASPREGSLDCWSMSVSAIDGEVTAINQTTTLSYSETQPDWGADASYFVYISDQSGSANLWIGDLTGSNRQVTDFAQRLSDPSVSPLPGAAQCVASLARADGGSDLVIIDLVGGTMVRNLTSPDTGEGARVTGLKATGDRN